MGKIMVSFSGFWEKNVFWESFNIVQEWNEGSVIFVGGYSDVRPEFWGLCGVSGFGFVCDFFRRDLWRRERDSGRSLSNLDTSAVKYHWGQFC